MFWMFRLGFGLLLLAFLGVAVATVPIGHKTLVEHTLAIFSTRPARQLGRDLAATGEQVSDEVRGAVQHIARRAGRGDQAPEGSDEPRWFGNPP